MSANSDLEAFIFSRPRYKTALQAIAIRSLLEDMPTIEPELMPARVDWRYALFCASLLTHSSSAEGGEAALRVAQGCITDPETTAGHREAAAVLLERLGNRRAIKLAQERGRVEDEAWAHVPATLRLDVIRRRIELTIPTRLGAEIHANPFQLAFWTSATDHRWLSVSAPTSAGKSYIVMRWLEELAAGRESFKAAYVVPTRALIDEVARELRRDLGQAIGVIVIPWDSAIGDKPREVYVFTQERLHLMQERDVAFKPDLLFIDEAQKLGDDSRGVLLQRVLDEFSRRRPDAQVIFASPASSNPEVLLEGAPPGAEPASFMSETATVGQNLLWLNQVRRSGDPWRVELLVEGEPVPVGELPLADAPKGERERLPVVAAELGGAGPGNVVYVNGAAEAELVALTIAELLRDRHGVDLSDNPQIDALAELASNAVHPDYRLPRVLRHGVAFHYGNMPLVIRAEVERLFREEVISYLVCTSTLLEGVNLPCRSLFARGPKRGGDAPMTLPDFWNLAGRAGRWGKEFRGNVICIDTSHKTVWAEVPRRRTRQPLVRASDRVLSDLDRLYISLSAADPAQAAREDPVGASVFSFLAARVAQGVPLDSIPGIDLIPTDRAELEQAIQSVLATVEIPPAVIARHAGVSPAAMQVLLDYFRGHPEPEELPVVLPQQDKAWLRYAKIFTRCGRHLGAPDFAKSDRRDAMLGILIENWMRGHPLRRIITERIKYVENRRRDEVRIDRLIRETMDDVEQIARFAAPKYMACYADVVSILLRERELVPEIATDDLTMMLELGVSRPTAVSLMGLGLSRTAALALSEWVEADDLSHDIVLEWLRTIPLDHMGLPVLVQKEVERVLASE